MNSVTPPRANVLIVEDDAVIALDLQMQLEQQGYNVIAAVANAADAVAAVGKARPDVAIVDVRIMGDVDGLSLAEELYVCEDVPVVLLTAYADPAFVERALAGGAYGYLTKPYEKGALLVTIALAVEKHRELRRVRAR